MSTSTVVVHGATGTQGAAIVRGLQAAGHHVRGIVRRSAARLPSGAEPVAADLQDPGSLAAAYAGADAVVVQLPLVFAADPARRQADAVLAGLRKAGVRRAVFNAGAVPPPGPIGVPIADVRTFVAAELPRVVDTAAVVAPAGPYLDNLVAPWSAPLVRAGEVAYPLPADVPVPWSALDDLAALVAEFVVADAPPPLRVVAGPRPLTGADVAAELSAALGHPVRWRTVPTGEYRDMLAPHLGEEAADGIAGSYAAGPVGPGPDPAVVVRGTTTLRAWARRQDWGS